jgi:hypothetical protein
MYIVLPCITCILLHRDDLCPHSCQWRKNQTSAITTFINVNLVRSDPSLSPTHFTSVFTALLSYYSIVLHLLQYSIVRSLYCSLTLLCRVYILRWLSASSVLLLATSLHRLRSIHDLVAASSQTPSRVFLHLCSQLFQSNRNSFTTSHGDGIDDYPLPIGLHDVQV